MYILYSGKVMVSRTLTMKTGRDTFADKDKSLNVLDDSTFPFLGELGLIERVPRSATVTCIVNCQLFEIKKGDFEKLCAEDSELGYRLMRNITEEVCALLRKNSNDILKLTTALSIALSR
ncbi:MAG: cyclic nucleotide-binding domain-containing protein [Firmicutes bacterium]|nr:cyclic nucleotide-binding domain-containing protein [Bacillota bacterium]